MSMSMDEARDQVGEAGRSVWAKVELLMSRRALTMFPWPAKMHSNELDWSWTYLERSSWSLVMAGIVREPICIFPPTQAVDDSSMTFMTVSISRCADGLRLGSDLTWAASIYARSDPSSMSTYANISE
jgi:hypothetical protein